MPLFANVKARKTLNAYDETGYVAYKAGPDADEGAMNVTIDYFTGDDFREGYGCLDIRYHFFWFAYDGES